MLTHDRLIFPHLYTSLIGLGIMTLAACSSSSSSPSALHLNNSPQQISAYYDENPEEVRIEDVAIAFALANGVAEGNVEAFVEAVLPPSLEIDLSPDYIANRDTLIQDTEFDCNGTRATPTDAAILYALNERTERSELLNYIDQILQLTPEVDEIPADCSLPSPVPPTPTPTGSPEPTPIPTAPPPVADCPVAHGANPVPLTPDLLVTTTANDGPGSLRDLILNASNGQIIGFDAEIFSSPQTIVINGEIQVPAGLTLTIDGPGPDQLTLSGNDQNRIFVTDFAEVSPSSLTIRNLTIANGRATTPAPNSDTLRGGAIATDFRSELTVEHVIFSNNVAPDGGGAILSDRDGSLTVLNSRFVENDATQNNLELAGGAITYVGSNPLIVRDSLFSNNRGINGGAIFIIQANVTVERTCFLENDLLEAEFDVGGPNDFLRGYGGALYTDRLSLPGEGGGTYLIRDSLFENNTARAAGGGIYLFTGGDAEMIVENTSFISNQSVGLPMGEPGNGGAIERQSNEVTQGMFISGSTFSNNRAVDRGGAIRVRNSPITITNTTFLDNRTTLLPTSESFEGGLGGALMLSDNTLATIRNVTFAENYATWVGGAITGSNADVFNTIFFNNVSDNGANDWGIEQHTTCNLRGSNNIQFPNNGNSCADITPGILTADPLLEPLADNGGLTQTMAIPNGSPAIDAGSNCPPTDQRGVTRPQGSECDIGAYER